MGVRRWKFLTGTGLLFLLVAGPSIAAGGGAEPSANGTPIASTAALDTAALNTRIRERERAGQKRRLGPVALVHELIGGSEEAPRTYIDRQSDQSTDFNRVSVTIVRDGFQDDSVRGDWHRFVLARQTDGTWTVLAAKKANRCYRGQTDTYRATPCP